MKFQDFEIGALALMALSAFLVTVWHLGQGPDGLGSGLVFGVITLLSVWKLVRDQRRRERLQREQARLRALEISQIDTMDGIVFELYVAELLRHRGWSVNLTKASGDLGVDLIAHQGDNKYSVQCKRYSKNVSRRAVSDAVAGRNHYGCQFAMVITNSWFTKGAYDLAKSNNCELVDRAKLTEWIMDFQSNGSTDGTSPGSSS
jgi:restriction system protein